MIFHDLKTVFMHVERTGGVSLRVHLEKYESKLERLGDTKHYTVEETKKIVGEYWEDYFTFGFVRNPYERLVSWYHACKQNPTWNNSLATHIKQCETFDDLIKCPHLKILIPQWDKVEGCDFIGRYENYEHDFKKICQQLKIPYTPTHRNAAKHDDYTKYYTEETKQIVGNWYKKDLEKFGYEF